MPEVNSINKQTKNSMPAFSYGKFANLQRLYNDGKMTAPALCIATDSDNEGVVFLDSKGVWHRLALDRITNLENQLEGMVDPETGEPVNVVTYVTDTVAPVEKQVVNVEERTSQTEDKVEKISNAITMITSSDIKEEVTE